MAVSAAGQSAPSPVADPSSQLQTAAPPSASLAPEGAAPAHPSSVAADAPQQLFDFPQQLFDFKDSDIKFSLQSLMNILRDGRHEGWVLAAYPDPHTSRPLIGAGFSLDVQRTDHPQLDPLNSHAFVEPSSAQLWQAAGLDPERLQAILDEYDRDLKSWTKSRYRRKIRAHTLTPQISEGEATRLLRISTIEAVQNARAYCRDFDQLTGSQQMALSQLVFQMGVNLQEFAQFLGVMNGDTGSPDRASTVGIETDAEHWKAVQRALMESQWARRYSGRAATVIAMFDPAYDQDPRMAERQVAAVLRPAVVHRRRARHAASLRVASYSRRAGPARHARGRRTQGKRKMA